MSASGGGAVSGAGSARGGSAQRWAPWLIPSLADVMFAAVLWFAVALRTHQLLNTDGDLGRHLAVGRQILADGAVPLVDLFSYTRAGESFVPYEWLSEVTFFLAYRQWGLEGVVLLSAVLVATPFLLLTRWMVREGANTLLVLPLVTVGALASSMHWLARPHLFTILLALLWTRALADHRRSLSPRHLLLLPPLMALWANLHGGFLVGFVVLGVFMAAALVQRRGMGALAAAGAASLLAVAANPAGFGVLPHVLSYFRSRLLVDNTVEYMSPDFHELGPQLFLGLLLVVVVSLAMAPGRIDLAELGMLVVWTAFSLYSARNIPLFMVICLPIVARLATAALDRQLSYVGRQPSAAIPLAPPLPDGERKPPNTHPRAPSTLASRLAATERQLGRPLLPALCVLTTLLLLVGALGESRPRPAFDPAVFPVQALPRVEEVGASGNVFNYFTWGGYMLYAAYPKHRVFIDGQTDFYGEELTRDYLAVARLKPDWESILDRHHVDWVLFPHRSPLCLLLSRSPGWRLVYEDATADIFVRE